MFKPKTQKNIIDIRKVGIFAKVVLLDHPEAKGKELARLISETFNCVCSTKHLDEYYQLYEYEESKANILTEDYELENRKQQYGIIY